MFIKFPEIKNKNVKMNENEVQSLWVYGPKDGKIRVYITHSEPIGSDELMEHIPHLCLSVDMCRSIAYLLNQAADKTEGKILSVTSDGYEVVD